MTTKIIATIFIRGIALFLALQGIFHLLSQYEAMQQLATVYQSTPFQAQAEEDYEIVPAQVAVSTTPAFFVFSFAYLVAAIGLFLLSGPLSSLLTIGLQTKNQS